MGSKRMKARTKNLPHLKCTFRVYQTEVVGVEILMRYKDKSICGVLPGWFVDVMDEEKFTNEVLPGVKKAFLRLKEIIDDAK